MQNSAQKLLANYLKSQNQDFKKLSNNAAKKLSPGTVHKLRSCIRRLRSSLWLLRKDISHSEFSRLNLRLRELGRRLGEIRQLDVAIEDAVNYHLRSRPLKRLRRQAAKKANSSLSRRECKWIQRKVDKTIAKTGKIKTSRLQSSGTELIFHLNERVRQHKPHKLRISVKKARYVLEALEIPSGPLKPLQEVMGRAHDLKVLRKLAGRSKKAEAERKNLKRKANQLIKPAIAFAKKELTGAQMMRATTDSARSQS